MKWITLHALASSLSVAVLLIPISATAHWRSMICTAPGAGLPVDYPQKLCNADDLARLGKYEQSAIEYKAVLEMPIYESPNFEALVDLARVQCLGGKIIAGKQTLAEFQMAAKVFDGTIKCASLRNQKNTIERRVFKRMCTELLSDTYKLVASQEVKNFITDLGQRHTAAENLCTLHQP